MEVNAADYHDIFNKNFFKRELAEYLMPREKSKPSRSESIDSNMHRVNKS